MHGHISIIHLEPVLQNEPVNNQFGINVGNNEDDAWYNEIPIQALGVSPGK